MPLFEYQFTYDELSGMERTQFSSFSELLDKGVKIDAHPAFVQILLYYFTEWFGYITWIIKLPFLLFSLGALIYAYAFGLRHFSKQSGLFASVFLGFSLIFVFYAPIARMYISGVFFSMALLFYFFEILFSNKKKGSDYFLLGLFALLSALNQHINALFAFTVCVSGLLFLKKETYKPYLITCLLVIVAYLPHLKITLYQLGVGGIGREQGGWLEAPEFSVLFGFVKVLFGTGKSYLVLLALLGLALVLNRQLQPDKKQVFLFILFVVNFLIVYFYSVFRFPIFQYSVMLFASVALVMLVSSGLQFKNTFVFYTALIVLFSTLAYKSYVKKDYLNQAVKTVFEYQFERTVYYKSLYGNKNVYPVFFDADAIMKRIYFEKYKTHFDCKISSDSMIANGDRIYYHVADTGKLISSVKLFSNFISDLNCDYLALSSAMPLQQAIVKQYFPYLLENTQTQGVNYKLYSRKREDAGRVVEDDEILFMSTAREPRAFNYPKVDKVKQDASGFLVEVDSLNEFPFDAKGDLNAICSQEGQVVLLESRLKLRNLKSEAELCLSVTDKNDNSSYAYTASAISDFVVAKDSTVSVYSQYFNGTNFKKVKNKSFINGYFWNRKKENFEIRNFEVKVIDYWPMKWKFWD